jgi:transposase
MDALPLDQRERVAAACDEGSRSQREVADDFGVSQSFITKLLRQRRRGGGFVAPPKPRAGGAPRKLDAAAGRRLRALVAGQPDATLAELADRLAGAGHARVDPATVCRALARLGLPRKKRPCGRPSGTRRASEACAARSGDGWPGSTRGNAWSSTNPARRRR